MATLGTFVAGQVLTAAELNAIGTYTDFSSSVTFSGFTLGNGTVQARYTQINKLVHYVGWVDLGSTSSMTGPLDVLMPVSCNTTTQPQLSLFAGTAEFFVNALYQGHPLQISANLVRLVTFRVDGVYAYTADMGASVPDTWNSSSAFFWNFVYEAA